MLPKLCYPQMVNKIVMPTSDGIMLLAVLWLSIPEKAD